MTYSVKPLNPVLFHRLQERFGKDAVSIVHAGVAVDWRLAKEPGDKYARRKVDRSGEEYKLDCPFCSDRRQRCYINHRWGVRDPDTGAYNLWLWQCFNESCQDTLANSQALYHQVFGPPSAAKLDIKIGKGKKPAARQEEVAPPGRLVRLDVLQRTTPSHYALRYLWDRYLDPLELASHGVAYCPNSRYHHATDRLIFPVYMNDKLVFWQARFIGDDVFGKSFSEARVPKYYGTPDVARGLILFNYERAVANYSTVILVEGILDAIGGGPMCIGCLGKTLSAEMAIKLAKDMRVWGDDACVVIALDPDQNEKERTKGRPHHIRTAAIQLHTLFPHVLEVYLPTGYDPGGTDQDFFHCLVRDAAEQEGVPINLERREKPDGETDTATRRPARLRRPCA